jgi:hypothetical protein
MKNSFSSEKIFYDKGFLRFLNDNSLVSKRLINLYDNQGKFNSNE